MKNVIYLILFCYIKDAKNQSYTNGESNDLYLCVQEIDKKSEVQ